MQASGAVRIDGLREFQAALKAAEGGLQKELRVMFKKAAEVVAANARPRTPSRSGRARGDIRVRADQRTASVTGGERVEYFGFLDYGNKRHSGKGVGRGDSNPRPFIKAGRILYPAYRATKPIVRTVISDGLDDLMRRSGIAVSHGG